MRVDHVPDVGQEFGLISSVRQTEKRGKICSNISLRSISCLATFQQETNIAVQKKNKKRLLQVMSSPIHILFLAKIQDPSIVAKLETSKATMKVTPTLFEERHQKETESSYQL